MIEKVAMERRNSTTSDTSTDSRQSSSDGSETALGRVAKTMSPKVAVNPLQFVKVGPCDLYRQAQEQLKKVEEVKKAKTEVKEEAEDWQSNLDNWKCSRRKRQEHIIERVVEVKKFEMEELERNRKRSKTFSEMMQDRNVRGRKTSLPVFQDDATDDLSDLGLSSGKNKQDSSESESNHGDDGACQNDERSVEVNGDGNGESTNTPKDKSPSKEPEYTYESAIQSYVNYTETRVKSKSLRSINEGASVNGFSKAPPVPAKPRRGSTPKIENIFSQLEKSKSESLSNISNEQTKKALGLQKVDIHKRRELFEKKQEEEKNSKLNKSTPDIASNKSIKERLSHLEKQVETTTKAPSTKPVTEISIKERLSNIEKTSVSPPSPVERKSSDSVSSHSIKERLSNLEKNKANSAKSLTVVDANVSIKDRLSSLQFACSKEPVKTVIPDHDNTFNDKLTAFKDVEQSADEAYSSTPKFERTYSPDEIYSRRQQHFHHRSLDSLDVDTDVPNGTFERVQSLEDIDYIQNYPASSMSGDTDREDSGIHTADVSSSVSQADDYELHSDTNTLDDFKLHHHTILEESKPEKEVLTFESYQASKCPDVSSPDFSSVDAELESEVVDRGSVLSSTNSKVLEAIPEVESPQSSLVEVIEEGVSTLPKLESGGEGACNASPATSVNTESDVQVVSNNQVVMRETKSLHPERRLTVVETCHKVDSSELNSPPITPFISVNTSSSFNIAKEQDDPRDMNGHVQTTDSDRTLTHSDASCEDSTLKSGDLDETVGSGDAPPIPVRRKSRDDQTFKKETEFKAPIQDIETGPIEPKSIMEHSHFTTICRMPMNDRVLNYRVEEDIFQLSPSALEPPKEKPPPPPTQMSDDEVETPVEKSTSLRRLDSTKRIKKEIRQKRSSFLGLEGNADDSYLEPELELIRPPDITTILAEERRIERQLYRQSVCSESDSNQESRDSGVELDHKHQDITWSHSRNDSEVTYGNHSSTSEEDEITKKEREIIEALEQEEKIRKQDFEKLAMRLREISEKERMDWERLQAENPSYPREHLNRTYPVEHNNHNTMQPEMKTHEISHQERDRHHQEIVMRHQPQPQLIQPVQKQAQPQLQWCNPRSSLQDIPQQTQQRAFHPNDFPLDHGKSLQDLSNGLSPSEPPKYTNMALRCSMPDLHEVTSTHRPPPPPPVLPAKPHNHLPTNANVNGSQQMSRQTLHALSAAPRSKVISNDAWQAKRKSRPDSYNYQHWLIQEAEHRRITEHQQKQQQAVPPRRPTAAPRSQIPTAQQGYHRSQPHPQVHPQTHPQAHPQVHPQGHQNGHPQAHSQHHAQPQTHSQHHAQPQSHFSGPPGSGPPPNWGSPASQWGQQTRDKPLPDSIIQTLTQRVQNKLNMSDTNNNRKRYESNHSSHPADNQKDKMLSVSGKKRCSHCGEELGRGAAMIIESLQLFYHIDCFKCCVCCIQLGDGLMGTDVRVRNNKLHCHNCYSSDDGAKFSCV